MGFIGDFIDDVLDVGEDIVDTVVDVVDVVFDVVGDTAETIWDIVEIAGSVVENVVTLDFDGLVEDAGDMLQLTIDVIMNLVDVIGEFVDDVVNLISEFVDEVYVIMEGIGNVFQEVLFDPLKDTLDEVFEDIPIVNEIWRGIRDALGYGATVFEEVMDFNVEEGPQILGAMLEAYIYSEIFAFFDGEELDMWETIRDGIGNFAANEAMGYYLNQQNINAMDFLRGIATNPLSPEQASALSTALNMPYDGEQGNEQFKNPIAKLLKKSAKKKRDSMRDVEDNRLYGDEPISIDDFAINQGGQIMVKKLF